MSAQNPDSISDDYASELLEWARNRPVESGTAGGPPFAYLLSPEDLRRLRTDLLTVLTETKLTGEPVDAFELSDILREFAEMAGWNGPLGNEPSADREFTLQVSSRDLKALRSASPAVQRVVEELFRGPLIQNPIGVAGAVSHRVKKMPDRDIWQVYLPDGFRLRYFVDQPERTVHVVYLGPHSDSRCDGREDSVRQTVHRLRLERRRESGDSGR